MIFKLPIESTLQALLQQEDTDGDKKITIEDKGPKAFSLLSNVGKTYIVLGTYHLSNVLQELVIAKFKGYTEVEIPLAKIEELPVTRISRMIREYYWKGLTRTIDKAGILQLIKDSKNESLTAKKLPIYIPFQDTVAFGYYKNLEVDYPIEAIQLPKNISPDFVKSINATPGILSLKLQEENGKVTGIPFVVPGGRFNEMYGWDSYFQSIGLLLDNKVDLAIATAEHFQYQIEHYGKILNANRSYYLTRTQPPFYSSLITDVFKITQNKSWLQSHLQTAILEYETVWMVQGKRLTENGLNRYLAEGLGFPPECEAGHFDAILKPYAAKLNMPVRDYEKAYANDKIINKELDAYFLQDRSVRESGHDTSYRIEGNCADLNLVELNAFLYKYEIDFANLIKDQFNDTFIIGSKSYTSVYWLDKANNRKDKVNQLLWNEKDGLYYDFNLKTKKQSDFIATTTFTPLWSNMASQEQANKIVENALPLLKQNGGVAGSTIESRGEITSERPARQWDYPNGWAPHQMLIWKGLLNYGFKEDAQELIYRWLFMITKNAVNYNGTIPEKYDVVEATHKVFAEYGNVGTDFEYITQEGFGWMNASYQYGLSLLKEKYIAKLNALTEPQIIF